MIKKAHYTAHMLCEGATLHHIACDRFKSERLQISFSIPLSREYAAKTAVLSAVLGRGSRIYSDIGLLSSALDDNYCATAYVDCGRVGEVQLLSFSMRALRASCVPQGVDVFSQTLSILASLMADPLLIDGAFSADFVESEKRNLINRIRGRVANKEVYASVRCTEEMTKEEAYAASVLDEEDIAPITPQVLFAHYEDILCHAPINVYYIGEKDISAISSLIDETLAPVYKKRTGNTIWAPQTDALRQAKGAVRTVSEEKDAKQGKICIGCRTGSVLADGDFYIFTLFNELFGTGATSRLFMRVREELNLCYYCSTSVDAHKGIMRIASGVEPANMQRTVDAIFTELADIAGGNISDEELAFAKRSLISGYRTVEDNASALMTWYANRAFAGISTTPDEAAAQVASVTKEQIAAAAKRISPELIYFMNANGKGEDDENEA